MPRDKEVDIELEEDFTLKAGKHKIIAGFSRDLNRNIVSIDGEIIGKKTIEDLEALGETKKEEVKEDVIPATKGQVEEAKKGSETPSETTTPPTDDTTPPPGSERIEGNPPKE